MTQTLGPGAAPRPPRVVLFRANAIDSDSRAKKFALTLARLGYEVHVLSAEEQGAPTGERRLGPVRVHPVILTHSVRDIQRLTLGARRRRQFRVIDWTPVDEYVTQIAEFKRRVRGARRRSDAVRSPDPDAAPRRTAWFPRWVVLRMLLSVAKARLLVRRSRWRAQWLLSVGYRQAWREWDRRKQATGFLATTRGVLPEVEDHAVSFGRVLDAIRPDVIHAHHPLVLGTAVRAARRRWADSNPCAVVYDARENFAGIPAEEQGNWRRHFVLVREEARYIREAAAVITVSEPIADVLRERYHLPQRPSVILNVPVGASPRDSASPRVLSVRTSAGLPAGTPLIVYSGAVSAARGIDVLIDAMAHLPGVHLALVTVPFPHPRTEALLQRAAALGAADRIHPLPPVEQDDLLAYLAGADVAVHPMPGGSPNHDQALPNKLFEYLHAGLPLVVSDAKLMADFVRRNDLGEVFTSGDPSALAAGVRKVLRSDRVRPSREELAGRYSWQAQEEMIGELYGRVAPLQAALRVHPAGLPAGFPDLQVTAVPVPASELGPDSLESSTAAPITAPIASAPIASAPIASAPIPSAPIPSAPNVTAPSSPRESSSTVNRGLL